MNNEIMKDIIMLSLPAIGIIMSSMTIEITAISMMVISVVFSSFPRIFSNYFNNNFAVIYGLFVGSMSFITSKVLA